jgi:tetratricopeptide (TPR) repeat protein
MNCIIRQKIINFFSEKMMEGRKMKKYEKIFLFLIFFTAITVQPLVFALDTQKSDALIAEKYFLWAQKAADQGRYAESIGALERALDFADVSSDIPYLLASLFLRQNYSRKAALETLQLALDADKWRFYSKEQGLLLQAEILNGLRRFESALSALAGVSESAEKCGLSLNALKGLNDREAFVNLAERALALYPRNPLFTRAIFTYFMDKLPEGQRESDLVYRALRGLPFIIESAPDLAFLAAPFILNTEDARLLVSAYLSSSDPLPEAVATALFLGVLSDTDAVERFFQPALDKDLILSIWKLSSDAGRDALRRKLLSFNGVITDDSDKDGIIETRVRYRNGRIISYAYDGDQDGIPEAAASFQDSAPVDAEIDGVRVQWERYPAARSAELNGSRYIFRPNAFFFAPLRMAELVQGACLFPEKNADAAELTERTLLAASLSLERDSKEFYGATEIVELEKGIPSRAREYLHNRLVSETVFKLGKPASQKVDLDLDGFFDTTRILE